MALFLIFCLQIQAEDMIYCYHDGFSVMNKEIELNLKAGTHEYTYDQLPSTVEIRSMVLRGLPDSVKVLQQSSDYDLKRREYLLDHCEGKEITYKIRNKFREQAFVNKDMGDSLLLANEEDYIPDNRVEEPVFEKYVKKKDIEIILIENADIPFKPLVKWKIFSPTNIIIKAKTTIILRGLYWGFRFNYIQNGDDLDLEEQILVRNFTDTDFRKTNCLLISNGIRNLNQDIDILILGVLGWDSMLMEYANNLKFEKQIILDLDKHQTQMIPFKSEKKIKHKLAKVFQVKKYNEDIADKIVSILRNTPDSLWIYRLGSEKKMYNRVQLLITDSLRSMITKSIPILNKNFNRNTVKAFYGKSVLNLSLSEEDNDFYNSSLGFSDAFVLYREMKQYYLDLCYEVWDVKKNRNLNFFLGNDEFSVEIQDIEICNKYFSNGKDIKLKITYSISNNTDSLQEIQLDYDLYSNKGKRKLMLNANEKKTIKVKYNKERYF